MGGNGKGYFRAMVMAQVKSYLASAIRENGISVLYISSELEELIRNCYRVVVIRDGRNVAELCGNGITEANIMKHIAKSTRETEAAHV